MTRRLKYTNSESPGSRFSIVPLGTNFSPSSRRCIGRFDRLVDVKISGVRQACIRWFTRAAPTPRRLSEGATYSIAMNPIVEAVVEHAVGDDDR